MPGTMKTAGIIFANMHDEKIKEISAHRTMGSVPFGGRYRLIDFPLSNMVNSGIYEIGVITKANYQSLMSHVGSGKEWDLTRKKEGLHVLPPFSDTGSVLYRGKVEALGGALPFLRRSTAKYVLLSDTDIIINTDFKKIIKAHIETGADLTAVYSKSVISADLAENSVLFNIDENNRINEVLCSSKMAGELNIFLNFIVADKAFLESIVEESLSKGLYSFDRDILQKKCKEYKMYGYRHEGFFRKIDSIKSYYDASMDLLNSDVRKQLFLDSRSIYTKIKDDAPTKYGLQSSAKNCLIADGCIIEGDVENSIIFRGVHVKKGARIRNSILMSGTVIGQKCDIQHVIADKRVNVTDYRTMLGSHLYPVMIAKGSTV